MLVKGWMSVGMFLVLVGCDAGDRYAGQGPTRPVEVVAEPQPTQPPMDLYAACRERVEGSEKPQECTKTADCKTVGCSGEVCVPVELEEQLTTCEVLPCYSVLDKCGCIDGFCRWSLRSVGEVIEPVSESRD